MLSLIPVNPLLPERKPKRDRSLPPGNKISRPWNQPLDPRNPTTPTRNGIGRGGDPWRSTCLVPFSVWGILDKWNWGRPHPPPPEGRADTPKRMDKDSPPGSILISQLPSFSGGRLPPDPRRSFTTVVPKEASPSQPRSFQRRVSGKFSMRLAESCGRRN